MINDLKTNMPLLTEIPSGHRTGEYLGVYGRVLQYYPARRARRCYQYVFVWDYNLILPHPMDYAPVFVFVDDYLNKKAVLFDSYHYRTGREGIEKNDDVVFSVNPWWHSFQYENHGESIPRTSNTYNHDYLTDDHLWHWWSFRNKKATFKLVDQIRNPEILHQTNSLIWKLQLREYISRLARGPFAHLLLTTHSVSESIKSLIRNTMARLRRKIPEVLHYSFLLANLSIFTSCQDAALIISKKSITDVVKTHVLASLNELNDLPCIEALDLIIKNSKRYEMSMIYEFLTDIGEYLADTPISASYIELLEELDSDERYRKEAEEAYNRLGLLLEVVRTYEGEFESKDMLPIILGFLN
jgi:hypothetical protein